MTWLISPIRDSRYTWIQDKVVFYAFEFMIEPRVFKLVATFNFYFDGLTAFPYSFSERVFFRPTANVDWGSLKLVDLPSLLYWGLGSFFKVEHASTTMFDVLSLWHLEMQGSIWRMSPFQLPTTWSCWRPTLRDLLIRTRSWWLGVWPSCTIARVTWLKEANGRSNS